MKNIKNCILYVVTMVCSCNCSQHGSLINSEAIVECSVLVLLFENPCYRKHLNVERSMKMQTVKTVSIPNGSMLNFAATGAIGGGIRTASRFNKISNHLGLSHSGIVVIDDPRNIYQLASRITGKIGEAILKELRQYHGDIISAVEAPQSPTLFRSRWNSAREVLRGIPPHVHIRDLTHRILEYAGNCYVRRIVRGNTNKSNTIIFGEQPRQAL